MKHRTHKDFPSYRFYSDGRIKNKTTNHFIKAIQEKANYKTWDELVKEYNIPMGSIGYLLKKGKDNPNGQVIINIDKVIIKG